ncbi:MAG TPA: NfeD family protein [Planctomycetota bacterium]|nr:NfeD family protein [Planctomycetota bacterium]
MTTLAVLLVLAAVGLLTLEIAVPSFGLFGVLAATAYTCSLIVGFRESRELGLTLVAVGVVSAPIAFFVGLKMMDKTRIGRRTMLAPPTDGEVGRSGAGAWKRLEGATGVAVTDLRPAGRAQFGEERVDVWSAQGYIPKASAVRVVRVEGVRVTVEAAASAAAEKETRS